MVTFFFPFDFFLDELDEVDVVGAEEDVMLLREVVLAEGFAGLVEGTEEGGFVVALDVSGLAFCASRLPPPDWLPCLPVEAGTAADNGDKVDSTLPRRSGGPETDF